MHSLLAYKSANSLKANFIECFFLHCPINLMRFSCRTRIRHFIGIRPAVKYFFGTHSKRNLYTGFYSICLLCLSLFPPSSLSFPSPFTSFHLFSTLFLPFIFDFDWLQSLKETNAILLSYQIRNVNCFVMHGRYSLDLLIKFRTSKRFFQGKGKKVRALSRLIVIAYECNAFLRFVFV